MTNQRDPIDDQLNRPTAGGDMGGQLSTSPATTTDQNKAPASSTRWCESDALSNISYELRTPLQGIMGMAEALSNTELSLEQRTSVRLLQTSAGSLLETVDDLLDYSLLENGKIELKSETFDLEKLVDDMRRVFDAPARQRGLRLHFEVRQDVPVLLKGDARRLRQVIANLMTNAIRFTPAGQVSLTVSMSARNLGGTTLHFLVSDTGIGIPADRQSDIFQPFVQVEGATTRLHSGTGLGLRIAAQLVRLMGGEIWVESAPDQGSRFHFLATMAPAVPVSAPAVAVNCSNAALTGDILLAEDNYINQMVTVRILESQGHRVVVGANGRLALDILERQSVDLVLMDIQMPEMDGFQATQAIRQKEASTGTHLPIIALTAHAMQGYRQKCLDAGMDEYLSKPICGKDLLDMVSRTLAAVRTEARG